MFYTYIAYYNDNNFHSVGVTNSLLRRIKILCQLPDTAARKQSCKIVYYEEFDESKQATLRESELLKLPRQLVSELVLEANPMCIDLLNE